jgi:hypothetical protein
LSIKRKLKLRELSGYSNFDIEIQKDNQHLITRLRSTDDLSALRNVSFDIKGITDELSKMKQVAEAGQNVPAVDTTHYRLGKRIYSSIFHASSQPWADEDVLRGDTLHLRLAVAQAISKHKEQRLRLIFRTNADSMPDTPIEFLCYRESEDRYGVFLALDRRLSLVRMPLLDTSFGKTTIPFPLRILVVISRNPFEDDFNPEEEKESLQKVFEELNGVSLDFMGTERDPDAIWPAVRDRINGVGLPNRTGFSNFYSMFHFIGHGKFEQSGRTTEGSIRLKDGDVPGSILGHTFEQQKTVRTVILQSCETATTDDVNAFNGVAQQIASARVPCVLGMQSKISAKAARKFMSSLYAGWLANNLQLEEAITHARSDLFEAARREAGIELTAWAAPVVFLTSEIEMKPWEEPVLPPAKQELANEHRARIEEYENMIEQMDAKLAQPLMPTERAASEVAKELFVKRLNDEERELAKVLSTYVNIGNAYATLGSADQVAVPLLLHVENSRPTKLEFHLRFETGVVEFIIIESRQGNSVTGRPFSFVTGLDGVTKIESRQGDSVTDRPSDIVQITVKNPPGQIIRDENEEIATFFFTLKSTAKSVILRAGKIKIWQGAETLPASWGSPGWILIKEEEPKEESATANQVAT